MPELPEVETIRRQLNKAIAGKKIKSVEVLLPKLIKAPLKEFQRAVVGTIIKKVERRAKILILELNNGWSFLIHLKLTGQLIFNGQKDKYTHVIFYFTDRSHLLFNDLRQFGYIKLIKTSDLTEFLRREDLGPEPLEKDFTLDDLSALIAQRPNAKIKQFLMDQKNIAGIGNIYSDEILFFAGVHPLRTNNTLKPEEIKKIYLGIKKILPEAIKYKGTSADMYIDAYGRQGDFLKHLKVYGREGQKCVKCQGLIKRIKIGGRSAHFCPNCQK